MPYITYASLAGSKDGAAEGTPAAEAAAPDAVAEPAAKRPKKEPMKVKQSPSSGELEVSSQPSVPVKAGPARAVKAKAVPPKEQHEPMAEAVQSALRRSSTEDMGGNKGS